MELPNSDFFLKNMLLREELAHNFQLLHFWIHLALTPGHASL